MKKVIIPMFVSASLFAIAGCSHSENDIKDTQSTPVTALYNDV